MRCRFCATTTKPLGNSSALLLVKSSTADNDATLECMITILMLSTVLALDGRTRQWWWRCRRHCYQRGGLARRRRWPPAPGGVGHTRHKSRGLWQLWTRRRTPLSRSLASMSSTAWWWRLEACQMTVQDWFLKGTGDQKTGFVHQGGKTNTAIGGGKLDF